MAPNRIRRSRDAVLIGRQRYSLTLATFQRRPQFTEPGIVEVVLLQIVRAAQATDFAILAYCFMPDHLHLLVQGTTDDASLPDFVKRAKQLSGHHGKRPVGCRICQPGYYERTLRLADRTDDAIDDILYNPVRAGLTPTAADYPYSATFRSRTCPT